MRGSHPCKNRQLVQQAYTNPIRAHLVTGVGCSVAGFRMEGRAVAAPGAMDARLAAAAGAMEARLAGAGASRLPAA